MKITAILAVCDADLAYLRPCLAHLTQHEIGAVVLDNTSYGAALEPVSEAVRRGASVSHVPNRQASVFSLKDQLRRKAELVAASDADWVIHLDVDEILHPNAGTGTLRDEIKRAEAIGFNAINFDEFVFFPIEGPYDTAPETASPDLVQRFRYYYFYEPKPNRLMRAWKRSSGASNVLHGGHRLEGEDLRVFPESLVLRHYIFLDQAHAHRKYTTRSYDADEVNSGWHHNRLDFEPEDFLFPLACEVEVMEDPRDRRLSRECPHKIHYWENNRRKRMERDAREQ